MHKWTTSACMVVAWCIVAAAGSWRSDRSAQANTGIAGSTKTNLSGAAGILLTVRALPAAASAAGTMPQWPKDVLLAGGLLAVIALTAAPAVSIGRRRRRAVRGGPGGKRGRGPHANGTTRIIVAGYERLIVTYSALDRTVYLLAPPEQNPQAVLRAARLVLPDRAYDDLADHLGGPPDEP